MECSCNCSRANKNDDELGGHIATFSSAAMLYDIGLIISLGDKKAKMMI